MNTTNAQKSARDRVGVDVDADNAARWVMIGCAAALVYCGVCIARQQRRKKLWNNARAAYRAVVNGEDHDPTEDNRPIDAPTVSKQISEAIAVAQPGELAQADPPGGVETAAIKLIATGSAALLLRSIANSVRNG